MHDINPYHYKQMMDFFNDPERVEKVVQRGKAEEFWSFDIEDFVTLLQRIINISWKRSDGAPWGTFSYEEPKSLTDTQESTQGEGIFPWITFDVLKRTPSQSIKGFKPRQFEIIVDKNNTDDYFRCHRMWYDCYVEFAIFAPTNREAVDAKIKFEALVHQYTGLLKEMGVSDIIFHEEVGSKSSNSSGWNKDIPCRTVTYLVRIERIVAVRNSYLKAVETKVRAYIEGLLDEDSQEPLIQYTFTEDGTTTSEDSEFMKLYDENY